jgi:hypothetical protein
LQIFSLGQELLATVNFEEDIELATSKYFDLAIKRGFIVDGDKDIYTNNSLLPIGILKNFPPQPTRLAPLIKCPHCSIDFSKTLLSKNALQKKNLACFCCKALNIKKSMERDWERNREDEEECCYYDDDDDDDYGSTGR